MHKTSTFVLQTDPLNVLNVIFKIYIIAYLTIKCIKRRTFYQYSVSPMLLCLCYKFQNQIQIKSVIAHFATCNVWYPFFR